MYPSSPGRPQPPSLDDVTSYRIQKIRCPVTVMFATGETIAGDVFLSPTSRFGPEPQAPWEFLNDIDPYFALDPADGRTLLAAKDHVLWAEVPKPSPVHAEAGEHPAAIEVTLVSGTTLSGEILLGPRTGHARLLDYLNSNRERFLRLVQPDRVILVNRSAVAHVHELN